jgi:hypothetical protein
MQGRQYPIISVLIVLGLLATAAGVYLCPTASGFETEVRSSEAFTQPPVQYVNVNGVSSPIAPTERESRCC